MQNKKNNAEQMQNKRGSILKSALEIINGARQNQYGDPEDSFQIIADYWTTYLKANELMKSDPHLGLDAREVAEMMTLLKLARMSGQKPTVDNYTDAAGYIGIAGDMVAE